MVPSLSVVSTLRFESCELTKHSRASLPKYCRFRSNKLFEFIHSDVWGPLSVNNHSQYKYYVFFIDDFSRMSWLYLMKDRTQLFSKLMEFINEILRQFSATLKIFQSDNALEYNSAQFKQYFASQGIINEPLVHVQPKKMKWLNTNTGTYWK